MFSSEAAPIDVRNPRTGKIDYSFTPTSLRDVVKTTKKLRQGQSDWEKAGLERRIEILQKWKTVLLEERNELINKITIDTGRLKESIGEVDGATNLIDKLCRLAPEIMEIRDRRDTSISFIKVGNDFTPYKLVGVISPWNFPYSISMMDAVPALLAGCAVIVKSSEVTPRFVETVNKTIEKVPILSEVLSFAVGDGETGAAVTENVDLICFTGSVETGRKVGVAAANRFIPSILELGGKDPAIVSETADINRAVSAILYGAVRNAGQLCVSIERIYVAESIFDEFVRHLIEKSKSLAFVYPNLDEGQIGPLIFAKQADIILDHLKDATKKGANIRTGGKIEHFGGGVWCPATVITEVDHRMKVMTEETFGPIMPVMPFKNIDEAVHLANDTVYGLTSSIFAGTAEEAIAIGRRINTGAININDCGLTPLLTGEGEERTSFHFSGMGGSRSGKAAILRFTQKKAIFTNNSSEDSPWWYEV